MNNQNKEENQMDAKKIITVLVHAFVVWVLCAAAMGIGRATTTEQNAFIIHAIAAPLIAALVSMTYFKRFYYTSPLLTAVIFVLVPAALDFVIVALIILRSMDMFASQGSLLGTWLPLSLIFLSTYLTGLAITKRASQPVAS
jgi:hydrogenase-4 membrane subunit HyfE